MERSISCHRPRSGITLIETLVAITIVSLLLAIILPAVQSARSTSRRMQCSNHQRQLLLALSNYAETHGTLPPLSMSGGGSGCPETGITRLFPYVDLPPICDIGKDVTRLAVLECPADAEIAQVERPLSYSFNASPGESAGSRAHGPFNEYSIVRTSDIIDGMSTTAALSENIVTLAGGSDALASKNASRYTWGVFVPVMSSASIANPLTESALAERAEQTDLSIVDCMQGPRNFTPVPFSALGQWIGRFGSGTWTYSHWYPPNVPNCSSQGSGTDSFLMQNRRAASGHAGGVNVGFLDGHGKFVSDTIDKHVWRAMGTRDGNEAVGDY